MTNLQNKKRSLELCLTPVLFSSIQTKPPFITVVVDVLRATSSMCAALFYGVKSIIPVSSPEEAKRWKSKAYPVAAEKDGEKLDFADFGNSPFDFDTPSVKGINLVYSTTNGTQSILLARNCGSIVLGAFVNFDVLTEWLLKQKEDVVILCSGWMNKFCLEDTVFAGCLSQHLLGSGAFDSDCDAVMASIDLWNNARTNLKAYFEKATHVHRLRRLGVDDCFDYCLTFNAAPVIPFFWKNELLDLTKNNK